MIQSYCGLLCNQCDYKVTHGCKGCMAMAPDMWHGKCLVAECAIAKGNQHCGQCDQFPCELLTKYSYDEEHGDKGVRIEQCKKWAQK